MPSEEKTNHIKANNQYIHNNKTNLINLSENIVYINNTESNEKISFIKDNGDKFLVKFKDKHTPYTYNKNNNQIQVVKKQNNDQVNHYWEYLKELADNKIIKDCKNKKEDSEINDENIKLSNKYVKINKPNIITFLYDYLSGKINNKINNELKVPVNDFIFPFGFNNSQHDATIKAINNRLSIIEGPPGTGKTQTILNIIANAVMLGKNVAVVSSNNSAIENVLEKLEQNDLGFIVALLGSKKNKENFIASQKDVPNLKTWQLENNEVNRIKKSLIDKCDNLQKSLQLKNELSALIEENDEIKIEYEHFKNDFNEKYDLSKEPKRINNIASSKEALRLQIPCEKDNISPTYGIKKIIKHVMSVIGLYSKEKFTIEILLRKYSIDYLMYCLQNSFYKNKLSEIEEKINNIKAFFINFDYEKEMKEYIELSKKLFKGNIAKSKEINNRKKYSSFNEVKHPEEFVKEYPVILSTTFSITSCFNTNFIYDYVIVDEASQVDICTGALAMNVAKHIVIVGDLKQLKHIVESTEEKIFDGIFYKYKMSDAYRYTTQSLLSSVRMLFKDAPRTLLREHYRCNPKIIGFCNKKFYNNVLVLLSNTNENSNKTDEREPLIVYKTAKGNFANGNINQRQIEVIKNEIIPNEKLNTDDDSVGITTPYRLQTIKLQNEFKGKGVEADTVDKFQGREKKIIIMSTVDNKIKQFTDNPNRINVAVSRAIEQFILVVNGNEDDNETIIDELVKYIEYNNIKNVKQSNIHSIFDLLYKSYADERKKYYEKYKNEKLFDFDSEIFMYNLINNTLKQDEYANFGFSTHYKLNLIFNDFALMNENEKKFIKNGWSHVDFLIYNKITKEFLLGIEVDGANYHKEGTRQYERDRLKDAIFVKNNLPLIRFSTKGSNEKEKLEQALNNATNKKLIVK